MYIETGNDYLRGRCLLQGDFAFPYNYRTPVSDNELIPRDFWVSRRWRSNGTWLSER